MPKRSKRSAPSPKAKTTTDRLKTRLTKCKKAELVDVLVRFAKENRDIQRQLESQFEMDVSPDELIAATRVAIADATDFDVREINHNFDYDYQAYRTVQRNFAQLIELGHLREAMGLSKELMSKGSYQVEMSDEGMMTEDIESCLQVVIKAITKSNLPATDVAAWCAEMAQRDRVGFVCDTELAALE